MKKLKPTKAWLLLCSILTVTYAATGHRTHYSRPNHGTSSHQKKYILSPVFAPIQIPEHVMSKTGQVSCVSADINIFDIMIEARASCKGNDKLVKFYYFADNKYYYIGAYEINEELFDALLMKYDNWLLTADRIDSKLAVTYLPDHIARIYNTKVNASRNKTKDWVGTSGVDSEEVPANKNLYIDKFDHDMYYYNNEPTEANKQSGNFNIKLPTTEYGRTVIDTEEKKGIYGNYIKVRPKFDKDRKYFEVFLPKEHHVGPGRTINVNINNEKDKYLYFEGDVDKVKSYKPVQVELKDHLVDITNSCTLNGKHENEAKTQNDNKNYDQRIRTSGLNTDFGSNGHDNNVNKVIYFKNKGLNEPHQYLNILDAAPMHDKTMINVHSLTPATNDQNINRVLSKNQHVIAEAEHSKDFNYNNYYIDLKSDELQSAFDDREANKIPAIASRDSAVIGNSNLNTPQYDKRYNLDTLYTVYENPNKHLYEQNVAPKRIKTEKLIDIYNAHDFDDSHQVAAHDKSHIHINEPVYKIKKPSRENDDHSAPYIFKLPKKYVADTELDYPKPNSVTYEAIPPISGLPSIPDILFDPVQTLKQFLDVSKSSKTDSQFSTAYTLAPTPTNPSSEDASMILPLNSNSNVLTSLPTPQYASFMPIPPVETVMLMKKGSEISPLNVGVTWLPSHSRIEELRIPNSIKPTSLDFISQNQLTPLLPVSSKEKLAITASETITNDHTNLLVEPATTKIIQSFELGSVQSPITHNQQRLDTTPMIVDQSNSAIEPHMLTLPSNIDFDKTKQGKVSSVTTIPFSSEAGINLPHHLQGSDLNTLLITPNLEYERISPLDSGWRDSSAIKGNQFDTRPVLKPPNFNVIAPDVSSPTICETPILNSLILTENPDISVESQYTSPISESPTYELTTPSDLISYQMPYISPLQKILSSYLQPLTKSKNPEHKISLMPSLSVLSDEELRNYLPIQHGINLRPSSDTGLVLNSDLIENTPCIEPFLEDVPTHSLSSIYRSDKTDLTANNGVYQHETPYETLSLPKQNTNSISDQDYTVIPSQKLQLSKILDKWSVPANPNLNAKLTNKELSYSEPGNTICPDNLQTLGEDLQRLLSESIASTPVEFQATPQENLNYISSKKPLINSLTLPQISKPIQYHTTPLSDQNNFPQHFLPNSDEESYQYIENETTQLKNIFNKPSLGSIKPQFASNPEPILPNTIFDNLPLDDNILSSPLNSPLLQPILQSLPSSLASKYPNNCLLGPALCPGLSPLYLPGPCPNYLSLPELTKSSIFSSASPLLPTDSVLSTDSPVNLFTPPLSAISKLLSNNPYALPMLKPIPLLPTTSYSNYIPLTSSSYIPQIVKPSYTPLLSSPQSITFNPALMGNIQTPHPSSLISTDDFPHQNIPYATGEIASIPTPHLIPYSVSNINKPVPLPSISNTQSNNFFQSSLESPDYIEYTSPNLPSPSVSNIGISSAVKPCFEPASSNIQQYDKSSQNIDYLNTPDNLLPFTALLSPTGNIQSTIPQYPLTIQSSDKTTALLNDILSTLQSIPESQYNAKLNPFIELKPILNYNSQVPEQSNYQNAHNNLETSSAIKPPVSKNFVKENAQLQAILDTFETISPIWSNIQNASSILSLLHPYKGMLPHSIADDYHIIPIDSQTNLQHTLLPEYVDISPMNYERLSHQSHLRPSSIASDPTLEGLSLSEIISNHPSLQSSAYKTPIEHITDILRPTPLVNPKKYLQNSISSPSEEISSLPATLLPHSDFKLSSPIATILPHDFSQAVPNHLSPHPYTNNFNVPTSLSYMPLIQNTESKLDDLSPTSPTHSLVEIDMPKDLLKLLQQEKHKLERLYLNSPPSDDFLINKEFNQINKHSPIISNIPENIAPLDYNSVMTTPISPTLLEYPISLKPMTAPSAMPTTQLGSNYPQTISNSQLNPVYNILDNYISEASPSLHLAGKHQTSNIGNAPTFTPTQMTQLSEPDLMQISQPCFEEQPTLTPESSVFLPLLVKTSTSENVGSPENYQDLKPSKYKHQSQSPDSYSILDNEELDAQSSTLSLPSHLLKPSLDDLMKKTYIKPNSQLLGTPISPLHDIPLEPCYTSNLSSPTLISPQYSIESLLPPYGAPYLPNQHQPVSFSRPLLPTFTSPPSLESITELYPNVSPIPLTYTEYQAPMFSTPIPSQAALLPLSTSPLADNTNPLATAYTSLVSPAFIQSSTNTRPILEAYSNPISFSPHIQSHDGQPVSASAIRPLLHALNAPITPYQSNILSQGHTNSLTPLYTSLNDDQLETIIPSVQSNFISPISSSSSLLNSQFKLNSLPQNSLLPLNYQYQARPSAITPNLTINPSIPIPDFSIPLNIGGNIPRDILEAIEQSLSSVSPLPKKIFSSSSDAVICDGSYITDEDINKELNLYSLLESYPKTTEEFKEIIAGKNSKEKYSPMLTVSGQSNIETYPNQNENLISPYYTPLSNTLQSPPLSITSPFLLPAQGNLPNSEFITVSPANTPQPTIPVLPSLLPSSSNVVSPILSVLPYVNPVCPIPPTLKKSIKNKPLSTLSSTAVNPLLNAKLSPYLSPTYELANLNPTLVRLDTLSNLYSIPSTQIPKTPLYSTKPTLTAPLSPVYPSDIINLGYSEALQLQPSIVPALKSISSLPYTILPSSPPLSLKPKPLSSKHTPYSPPYTILPSSALLSPQFKPPISHSIPSSSSFNIAPTISPISKQPVSNRVPLSPSYIELISNIPQLQGSLTRPLVPKPNKYQSPLTPLYTKLQDTLPIKTHSLPSQYINSAPILIEDLKSPIIPKTNPYHHITELEAMPCLDLESYVFENLNTLPTSKFPHPQSPLVNIASENPCECKQLIQKNSPTVSPQSLSDQMFTQESLPSSLIPSLSSESLLSEEYLDSSQTQNLSPNTISSTSLPFDSSSQSTSKSYSSFTPQYSSLKGSKSFLRPSFNLYHPYKQLYSNLRPIGQAFSPQTAPSPPFISTVMHPNPLATALYTQMDVEPSSAIDMSSSQNLLPYSPPLKPILPLPSPLNVPIYGSRISPSDIINSPIGSNSKTYPGSPLLYVSNLPPLSEPITTDLKPPIPQYSDASQIKPLSPGLTATLNHLPSLTKPLTHSVISQLLQTPNLQYTHQPTFSIPKLSPVISHLSTGMNTELFPLAQHPYSLAPQSTILDKSIPNTDKLSSSIPNYIQELTPEQTEYLNTQDIFEPVLDEQHSYPQTSIASKYLSLPTGLPQRQTNPYLSLLPAESLTLPSEIADSAQSLPLLSNKGVPISSYYSPQFIPTLNPLYRYSQVTPFPIQSSPFKSTNSISDLQPLLSYAAPAKPTSFNQLETLPLLSPSSLNPEALQSYSSLNTPSDTPKPLIVSPVTFLKYSGSSPTDAPKSTVPYESLSSYSPSDKEGINQELVNSNYISYAELNPPSLEDIKQGVHTYSTVYSQLEDTLSDAIEPEVCADNIQYLETISTPDVSPSSLSGHSNSDYSEIIPQAVNSHAPHTPLHNTVPLYAQSLPNDVPLRLLSSPLTLGSLNTLLPNDANYYVHTSNLPGQSGPVLLKGDTKSHPSSPASLLSPYIANLLPMPLLKVRPTIITSQPEQWSQNSDRIPSHIGMKPMSLPYPLKSLAISEIPYISNNLEATAQTKLPSIDPKVNSEENYMEVDANVSLDEVFENAETQKHLSELEEANFEEAIFDTNSRDLTVTPSKPKHIDEGISKIAQPFKHNNYAKDIYEELGLETELKPSFTEENFDYFANLISNNLLELNEDEYATYDAENEENINTQYTNVDSSDFNVGRIPNNVIEGEYINEDNAESNLASNSKFIHPNPINSLPIIPKYLPINVLNSNIGYKVSPINIASNQNNILSQLSKIDPKYTPYNVNRESYTASPIKMHTPDPIALVYSNYKTVPNAYDNSKYGSYYTNKDSSPVDKNYPITVGLYDKNPVTKDLTNDFTKIPTSLYNLSPYVNTVASTSNMDSNLQNTLNSLTKSNFANSPIILDNFSQIPRDFTTPSNNLFNNIDNTKYLGYKTYTPRFTPNIYQNVIPKGPYSNSDSFKSFPHYENALNAVESTPSNWDLNNIQQSLKSNVDPIEDMPVCNMEVDDDLKISLINYINKNKDKFNLNNEVVLPIESFAIANGEPCYNYTIKTNNPSVGLKVWKSNIKLVQAEIKLKFKDLSVMNFMPIVDSLNENDVSYINEILKEYINEKYGNHIEVKEPYVISNQYKLIKDFDNNYGGKYNLLWPAQCVS